MGELNANQVPEILSANHLDFLTILEGMEIGLRRKGRFFPILWKNTPAGTWA